MAAAAFKADNLCGILDCNGVQATDTTENTFPIHDFNAKWTSFGWHVIEIDGHDAGQILDALDAAGKVKGQPTLILAHTIKGKGFPFAEGKAKYHNAGLSQEDYEAAQAAIAQMRKEV